jgi:hypothetical protein
VVGVGSATSPTCGSRSPVPRPGKRRADVASALSCQTTLTDYARVAKIVPTERLRRQLDEVLAGVGNHDDPVEAVARLGARLILQQELEDEVTELIGRERYARADSAGAIYRNGYEPRTVKTTSGTRPATRLWGFHGQESADSRRSQER